MTQETGTTRPGGRTARTREAVHAAVRELITERGASAVTIPLVADCSGIHQATIYRRWRTPEALLLDLAAEELAEQSPVPATGDLAADLTTYTCRLATELAQPGNLGFFQTIVAASTAGGTGSAQEFTAPRLAQFQLMLDAAGVTELNTLDVFELVLAPVLMWGLLSALPKNETVPIDDPDIRRIVANVMAVLRDRRR